MSRHLSRYVGRLTPAEIARGMTLARSNANRLATDARTMLGLDRLPTAVALATLAIEEAGKVAILRALSTVQTDAEAKKEWQRYRSHRSKNGMWILPHEAANGARYLRDLAHLVDPKAEHTDILDSLKQVAFYSDCLGDGHWSDPVACVDRALAERLVRTADILSRKYEHSTREIELWVMIVGPHVASTDALLRWHQAMHDEGLTETPVEKFATFVLGTADTQMLGELH